MDLHIARLRRARQTTRDLNNRMMRQHIGLQVNHPLQIVHLQDRLQHLAVPLDPLPHLAVPQDHLHQASDLKNNLC